MFRLSKKVEIQVKHSQEFFHIAIVGRSGCGKTRFLLQLLEQELRGKFNAIFFICPTFIKNQSYDSFHWKEDKFYVIPNSVDETVPLPQKKNPETKEEYETLG